MNIWTEPDIYKIKTGLTKPGAQDNTLKTRIGFLTETKLPPIIKTYIHLLL